LIRVAEVLPAIVIEDAPGEFIEQSTDGLALADVGVGEPV